MILFPRVVPATPWRFLRVGWQHLRTERQRLGDSPAATATSATKEPPSYRWIDPRAIAGARHAALLVNGGARLEWRASCPPRARVAAWCAVLSGAGNAGAVEFVISVASGDGRRLAERARLVTASPGGGAARGHRLAVRLANTSPQDVRITLETRRRGGLSAVDAQPVWGDPQIERDRSLAEVAQLLRRQWRHRRLTDVVRRLRAHAQSNADDAVRYRDWVRRHTPGAGALRALAGRAAAVPAPPRFSVLMAVSNAEPGLLRTTLESLTAQVYPHWELCLAIHPASMSLMDDTLRGLGGDSRVKLTVSVPRDEAAPWNDALAHASGEYVCLLEQHDALAPDALAEMALAIAADPDADVLYSDEDRLTVAGERCDPCFKPDWSPDQLLGQMYTSHVTVARAALVRQVGAFRAGYDGAMLYDLWLRMTRTTPRVLHVPKVLYHARESSEARFADRQREADLGARRAVQDHMAARGVEATVEPGQAPGLWRVRRRIVGAPEVTVVIPTAGVIRESPAGSVDLLARVVRCVATRTSWPNYRLLIVDNGDLKPETEAAISTLPHERLTYTSPPGPFNFARKLNFAVRHVETEYFTTLNDDVEIITPEWIEGLLEFGQDPEIGAVGCKLRFPDGRLQHVGVAVGVTGIAAHLFHHARPDAPGWNWSAMTVRNYSAVTAALMMTRRDVWDEAGGFDERLRVDYNDVDFCLRLRELGYRIVYTPFVEAYHHESGSFGSRLPDPDDTAVMEGKWRAAFRRDPYYNPNLSRDTHDCRLPE